MRDIRSDLEERLAAIAKQRTELNERLRVVEARERRLRALLREEEILRSSAERLQVLPFAASIEAPAGAYVREFLLGSLADGRDWSLDDLKEHADRLGVTASSATGRSLNITLVNLQRRGRVERLANGRWRLCETDAQGTLALQHPAPCTI